MDFIDNLNELKLNRPTESSISTEERNLYSESNLELLDAWFRSLPIPVAFECQKLASNFLLNPDEIFYCKPKVKHLIETYRKSTSEIVAILAEFAKLILEGEVGADENTGQEAIDVCFKRAIDSASSYLPLIDDSLFFCRHVSVSPTALFLEGPFIDE